MVAMESSVRVRRASSVRRPGRARAASPAAVGRHTAAVAAGQCGSRVTPPTALGKCLILLCFTMVFDVFSITVRGFGKPVRVRQRHNRNYASANAKPFVLPRFSRVPHWDPHLSGVRPQRAAKEA